MRLNYQDKSICLGSIEINELSRVVELDSGLITRPSKYENLYDGSMTVCHSYESLQNIERQLAIIVPVMDDELSVLHGVLCGIPHDCLIIVVSNSSMDNHKAECAMLNMFGAETQHRVTFTHQADPELANAFAAAGMPHIAPQNASLNSQTCAGRTRDNKAEAMMIGTVFAKIFQREFVGFIDASNIVPSAVHEYCKVFATGLYHALNTPSSRPQANLNSMDARPLAMVRIKWQTKPKIINGEILSQEFEHCSHIINVWANRLFASLTGYGGEFDFIKTANAWEHAMSTELAMKLNFATGYAAEPFQLIDLWERSGANIPSLSRPAFTRLPRVGEPLQASQVPFGRHIRIMQVETLNPHIHNFDKDEEHVARVHAQGIGAIFHSRLASPQLKSELRHIMKKRLGSVVDEFGEPEQALVYPPLEGLNFEAFEERLKC